VICYNVLHCSQKAASPLVLECYEVLYEFDVLNQIHIFIIIIKHDKAQLISTN
jgi:hypothetical protein